jgi:hypothetical protein
MKPNESMVLALCLPVETGERLERFAKRKGWTLAEAGAILVEEGLKRREAIDSRHSPEGRVAYLKADSLTPSELISLVLSNDDDLSAVAWHLGWSEDKVRAALDYAEMSGGSRSPEEKESDLG